MTPSFKRKVRLARKALTTQTARADAWTDACNADGIDPDSRFAFLSAENPHKARHDYYTRKMIKLITNLAPPSREEK